jgi:hypothetical protein
MRPRAGWPRARLGQTPPQPAATPAPSSPGSPPSWGAGLAGTGGAGAVGGAAAAPPQRLAQQRRRHTEDRIAARVAQLGFADVKAYLVDRVVEQAWLPGCARPPEPGRLAEFILGMPGAAMAARSTPRRRPAALGIGWLSVVDARRRGRRERPDQCDGDMLAPGRWCLMTPSHRARAPVQPRWSVPSLRHPRDCGEVHDGVHRQAWPSLAARMAWPRVIAWAAGHGLATRRCWTRPSLIPGRRNRVGW